MSADAHRLFVALPAPDPVRAALHALAHGLARAHWTPVAQLHLTLRFIGTVDTAALARVREALERVRIEPFLLGLEGVGRFPPRGQPGVVWVGVGSGHPRLHQLRQQVDDALLATGMPFVLRPFVPHFTLARTRDCAPGAVADWLKRHRDFIGPAWRVDIFQLMESTLQPAGAEHLPVQPYALKT